MRHRIAIWRKTNANKIEAATEANLVHYDGPSLVGWQTLCGHVDRTDITWVSTKKRVNCPGCLDVLRHVKGPG